VPQVNAAIHERPPDEQSSVTLDRVLLAAHQREPPGPSAGDDPVEGGPERRLLCHQVVSGMAVRVLMLRATRPATEAVPVLMLRVTRPATEAVPEEDVRDARSVERRPQQPGREMLAVDAARIGPHVRERLNFRAGQQGQAVRKLNVRMPDGQDDGRRLRHGSRAILRVVALIERLPKLPPKSTTATPGSWETTLPML